MNDTSPERQAIDTRAGYDLWAPSYDHTENPVVALDEQLLTDLIGDPGGLRILDAGCGTGRHTVRLARSAARVVGLDFAPEMLAQARAKLAADAGDAVVELHVHDLQRTPYPLDADSVDGVVCALVGEHLTDLPAVFAEFARVLVPGGWLVFSVYHPLLALRGVEANFTAADTGVEYRLGAETHLVADYITAMLAAGYRLHSVREPVVDDDLVERVPRAAKYLGQPLLLLLRGIL